MTSNSTACVTSMIRYPVKSIGGRSNCSIYTHRFVLFIDSREQPDLDTACRIAAAEALHAGGDQLCLTESEVERVLKGLAIHEEAKLIHRQTEGWPVVIQLLAAGRRTQPELSAAEGLSGGLIDSITSWRILCTPSAASWAVVPDHSSAVSGKPGAFHTKVWSLPKTRGG